MSPNYQLILILKNILITNFWFHFADCLIAFGGIEYSQFDVLQFQKW